MRWALLLALATLSSCATRKPCALPTIPAAQHGPAFLWKVTTKDGSGDPVWLYGTIHSEGLEAVPQIARDQLEKSVRYVSELGDGTPDKDKFRELARVQSGPGIDQRLPSDDWYDLRDALNGHIREDDLRRARPWYAMSLLTTYSTPEPGPSMDVLLAKRAAELAMPVESLETWEEQITALDAAVSVDDLREAIHARNTMTCDLSRMRAYYDAGDTESMTTLLVVPRTEPTILTARNKKWMTKLETYFAKGGAFVAVGLGHLLGNNSLPAMFEKAGYIVERTKTR